MTVSVIDVMPVVASVGVGEIELSSTPDARTTWLSSSSRFGMSVVIGIAFDSL